MKQLYSEEITRKEFTDEVSKQAYLKACKWLAQNVYCSPSYSEKISVQIMKRENKEVQKIKGKKKEVIVSYTFIVVIFISLNEKEMKEQFCKNCKHLHNVFYSIEKPRCEECKFTAYRKFVQSQIGSLKNDFEEEFNG